jgi:Ni,Fe-hydrogenase III component G
MNTKEALALANEIVKSWDWETEIGEPEPNRLDVNLKSPEDLLPIVVALRVKRLGFLSAITGLDAGSETGLLEVLYHFCAAAAVITLRIKLPRNNAVVQSLCEIIPSAETFERELSEMFGVEITGLTNPEYLYLPDDWPEGIYPLRKDFTPQALLTDMDEDYVYATEPEK